MFLLVRFKVHYLGKDLGLGSPTATHEDVKIVEFDKTVEFDPDYNSEFSKCTRKLSMIVLLFTKTKFSLSKA